MSNRAPILELVVPAYNEVNRLPATLVALRSALGQLGVSCVITVVDNASTDGTAQIALTQPDGPVPVRLVRCPIRGKGNAVRAGVAASRGQFVGFCDADLATALDDLPRILELLHEGIDVVVGSRALAESDVQARHSPARQWGAAMFRFAVRQSVASVGDTQCGFKFFHGHLARTVFAETRCGGFAFDVEVLARAERRGARIVEIPVTWVDVAGSTFSPVRDGWRSFVEVAGIAVRLRRQDRRAAAAAPVWRPVRRPAVAPADVAAPNLLPNGALPALETGDGA